ncbi:DVU0298 family protein [Desulfonatronum parangueonense]
MAEFRTLKKEFSSFLVQDDWQEKLSTYFDLPRRKLLGPLFSLLLAPEPLLKWRAVSAFGVVTADLAEQDMESARVIMRRLMWNLNEESGAVGWGAPESMGETLARSPALAREFNRILTAYAQEPVSGDGIYLDHAPLRWGAYWGMARLAEVRPELMEQGLTTFSEIATKDDPLDRAVGAWGLGSVGNAQHVPILENLTEDAHQVALYRNDRLQTYRIADLALEAIAGIQSETT